MKFLEEDTVTLYFTVADSGIGMTPEQIAYVFEPFTQADISTTRKYGGTGLGLTITKNILDTMGSRLEVESTPGIGTKFSFKVTLGIADETDLPLEAESNTGEIKKPMFEGVVLVVEDNNMNQQVATEHLAKVGLKSEIAENGLEGLEKIKRRIESGDKPYDLIFMDIHMPVMDGIEATPKIIALGSGTPIVAISANVMSEEREIYRKLGMADYLGKPYTSQELWHCLLRHLQPVSFEDFEDTGDILQNKLKTEFIKNNQDKFDEITNAIESGDIVLAHRLAHTIKSNAGLIGMTDLQKAAADVESVLKSGNSRVSEVQMSLLQFELDVVLKELTPFLDETEILPETSQPPLDTDATRELFNKLEPMLHDSNIECVDLISELQRIPGTEELIEQMEDFNFIAAAKILVALRETSDENNEK
jgi:CheY-like chemotaxis protein